MRIVGIAGLIDVFGGTRLTWKARIEAGLPVEVRQAEHSGKAHVFDSRAVLGWLLEQAGAAPGKLDPQQERARYDEARRKLCELQICEKERKLIPADVVERVWSGITSAARQRFLAMPSTATPQLAACNSDYQSIQAVLYDRVCEALQDVSNIDIDRYV